MPFKYLFTHGLYKETKINDTNKWEILHLMHLSDKDRYDYYCPTCKDTSIYKGISSWPRAWEKNGLKEVNSWSELVFRGSIAKRARSRSGYIEENNILEYILNIGSFETEVKCSRIDTHYVKAFFLIENQSLIKIGQYPSMANLDFGRLNKYRKLLSSQDSEELGRAIGLHAHGVGVGSFVYLRRVFERIIKSKAGNLIKDGVISEDDFISLRMNEKIETLKDQLPTFMVEHPQLYSILSRGIHDLEEDECLEQFEIILQSTELIFEQILEEEERKRREKLLSKKISGIKK